MVIVALLAFLLTVILCLSDDRGGTFYILKRLLCLLGKHRFSYKDIFGRKVKCYYCATCKKPGPFPYLRLIRGEGKRIDENTYKF